MGGGFGVKFGTYPEDVVVAALARQRRVPLRWIETRVEHMMTTTHGRGQVTDMEAAVDADGRITGLRMHVLADIGAYPIFTFIPDLTLMMGVGVYGVQGRGPQEHLRLHQYDLDRRLPRRRPAGGRLLSRAARGRDRR